jgi:transcriptional regulator with GAF, ATPase, and Fis domain
MSHPDEAPDELRRHLYELTALYEIARCLIGARDEAQLAARIVLSVIGSIGVRSGALFAIDERGRYRVLHAELDEPAEGRSVLVPSTAREWMLRSGAFVLRSPAARNALGDLHDKLVRDFDAVLGIAVPDSNGLLAFLVFGPRLIPIEYDESELALLDSLGALIAQSLETHRGRSSTVSKRRRASRPARTMAMLRSEYRAFDDMIGDSASLLATCQTLLSSAASRFPVLLEGETGVGKELAARAIHDLSDRATGAFEVVDCGSIPSELIESEVFGHVRGAFTGAHRDRRGAFELAHRGTLFLDEIGEMPLQLQTRLLRVLQEGRIRRVGDERAIDVDVRVVAATNRDLRAEVAAKRFREDLFYRLNVFAVPIRPLRERPDDVEPLVRHFLSIHRRDDETWEIDDEVWEALRSYAWPGNIRELSNLCAALSVQARDRDTITLDDLDAVWRLQHGGEAPPWESGGAKRRGQLGDWVLERAREARFNLLEAESDLKRRKRSGQTIPLTERSALAYYLTGEILRALADAGGDEDKATTAVAGREGLERRVSPRVAKVADALRAARDHDLRRRFAKLPAGYEDVLVRAHRSVSGK